MGPRDRPGVGQGTGCGLFEVLVKMVFAMARFHSLQVGDVFCQLFDGSHCLLQEVLLQEVGKLQWDRFRVLQFG